MPEWLPMVVNVTLVILSSMVGFLLTRQARLERDLQELRIKVATDYSGLPNKIDKLSEDFEKFREEFQHEFLPLLYEIRGQLRSGAGGG